MSTGTGGDRDFLVSSSADYAGQDRITLSAVNLDTVSLGIDTTAADFDSKRLTSTGADFRGWLTKLDTAVDRVNTGLGSIGAAQNRISFATQNVKSTIENFAAAESTIRDADMASEMTELSRVQILAQAGTAMLAQANQAPQGVLQLLR